MTAQQRRCAVWDLLQQSDVPLSGSALAKALGVSRQIIVQDIALLRVQHPEQILSTYQGYLLLHPKETCRRVFKVRHSADRTEEELQEIVDLGGFVEDVFVYHRVYGVVRGQLSIGTRANIQEFMKRLADSRSGPLMLITDDFHYHTVTAQQEAILDAIGARLEQLGFLAPLLEHEPEGLHAAPATSK